MGVGFCGYLHFKTSLFPFNNEGEGGFQLWVLKSIIQEDIYCLGLLNILIIV